MDDQYKIAIELDDNRDTKYMKYFKIDEFNCKCCGKNEIKQELIDDLEHARELAGIPFVINSGYRCPKHNKEVGGKTNSSHLQGLAVDIKAVNSRDKYLILKSLIISGFNRIGIGSDFIHCDIDNTKDIQVIWTY